jgi:hypothetical protein
MGATISFSKVIEIFHYCEHGVHHNFLFYNNVDYFDGYSAPHFVSRIRMLRWSLDGAWEHKNMKCEK